VNFPVAESLGSHKAKKFLSVVGGADGVLGTDRTYAKSISSPPKESHSVSPSGLRKQGSASKPFELG
jgi:hypothetical protein